MHRIIMNCPDEYEIDHINNNPLDNRKENLRICSHRENTYNVSKQKNCSSKYKGVCYHKIAKKWMTSIRKDGRSIYLGLYEDEQEAAKVYNEAAQKYFGKFAKLNDVA